MYWKSRKVNTLTTKTDLPIGTFVKTEKGYFYIVAKNKRYRFLTKRVLDSWAPHRIVEATETAVAHYRIYSKMKFRNGSLIHSISDGKIYLISEGKRRHVTNPDVLKNIGAVPSEVVSVSLNEILLHEIGEQLD